MVRCNSIEASTRSSMVDFDDSEFIHSSEFQEHPDQATLKFLRGGDTRLVDTTADLSNRVGSVESTMVAIQRTLRQISNQLGKRPIEAEPSHHSPPVTHSDSYARAEFNRFPLDNRTRVLRKIEMPKFDGTNAYDWLSKVERFFSVGRYSDLDKLDLVAFSLEGDVLRWFNWEVNRCEFHSWEEFRRRLFRRFGAAPAEAPDNRLFASKQKGTISAYVTEFEELSPQVIGLEDSHLAQIFDNGLQTEMTEVLKLKESIGLENHKESRCLKAQVIEQQTVHKEESITQLQVHVSKLDHSLHIHKESPNVCENYQDVVGCDAWGKEENLFSGLSQASQVWEPGGVFKLKEPVGLVTQKKTRCLQASLFNFKRKKKRIKRRHNQLKHNYASVREDWFNTLSCRDWRKHKHENLQIVSGVLGFNVVSFRCHKEYGLTKQIEENLVFQQLVIAQKIECGWICGDVKFHLKHKWRFRLLQSFSRLILWALVSLCFRKAYALSELLKDSNNGTAESLMAAEKFYRKVQPLLWLQISSENYLMVLEFENKKQLLGYKSRMFKYKAPFRRGQFLQYFAQEVPMQLVVDWLRKAAHILGLTHPFRPGLAIGVPPALVAGTLLVPENFWLFSKGFVQLYPSSKLEDKLVFGEGSIDTLQGCGDVATTKGRSKDSVAKGGFAVLAN